MSLPPELRVLCFQLSSTPPTDLPRLLPTLLSHVYRCQVPLSSPAGNATQADASASSVLVHKLKTHLSSLLNGKSLEGRFTAVVLIKAVVEVGGWEILQGAESWARGLLTILGKPDSAAVKELCIMTLSKIYCMTQQYQTLIREITTPTLPTFVTSCLNLISASSKKSQGRPSSLDEIIFHSFAMLLPRHTTIFRPFASQIRVATRPYLAPTMSDGFYASQALRDSARRLVVVLHQTAAKNTSAEEWSRAVRELVTGIHMTADCVFRAVVEDWESTAGHVSAAIDVNQALAGGSATAEDLPSWTGIYAGVERLTGRLELLTEYIKTETSAPVTMPLGMIMDLITRMLSIAIPSSDPSAGYRGARLHPAIDRDERDGLWTGMPQIYVAALKLVDTISMRLENGFLPLALESFDQLAWAFEYGKHSPEFRSIAYVVTAKILVQIGQSFNRAQCDKLVPIVQSCCRDLQEAHPNFTDAAIDDAGAKPQRNSSTDTFLRTKVAISMEQSANDSDVAAAAKELLPLVLSHLPQSYLSLSMRALVDRTSILTHDKDAMLASILNPAIARNGAALPSILPHLTREFGHDAVVEILLRPRMPVIPSTARHTSVDGAVDEGVEDEEMNLHPDSTSTHQDSRSMPNSTHPDPFAASSQPGLGSATDMPVGQSSKHHSSFATSNLSSEVPSMGDHHLSATEVRQATHATPIEQTEDPMAEDNESSDDESVHLTMQLDTDSEDDA
ncbi:uncharacterized protein L3040_004405 [Drepanopeziza brunnea f. sp. 'multigermtubi']|uniref:Pre-rRNA-processing protein RIX1 n=1 Tax=Marssonina brunnea f. sp. multigermtubi (strain MB_m1) TaxID=1072389 RepID=K1WZ13_MARBU|nr:uncharacterized protein MBM_03639 [Drepanopeziza brunnea f. sp. 'multigermtubi' MB_m1]EKD17867.1 hypothetical protein MBM_03639 [Drepanopeziza brunnea f. sp. 'multigermtubi' MB_m1]KAJ5043016.1 hypothetical protein L3040_004405 [Drepanopeziza brunnea f. sp. 'multigermtubi']